MGKRREPRKQVQLPVRIFGTDAEGRIFSENATTIDISQNGAKLSGVKTRMQPEEIVGLTYARNKVHFRIQVGGRTGYRQGGFR